MPIMICTLVQQLYYVDCMKLTFTVLYRYNKYRKLYFKIFLQLMTNFIWYINIPSVHVVFFLLTNFFSHRFVDNKFAVYIRFLFHRFAVNNNLVIYRKFLFHKFAVNNKLAMYFRFLIHRFVVDNNLAIYIKFLFSQICC